MHTVTQFPFYNDGRPGSQPGKGCAHSSFRLPISVNGANPAQVCPKFYLPDSTSCWQEILITTHASPPLSAASSETQRSSRAVSEKKPSLINRLCQVCHYSEQKAAVFLYVALIRV